MQSEHADHYSTEAFYLERVFYYFIIHAIDLGRKTEMVDFKIDPSLISK